MRPDYLETVPDLLAVALADLGPMEGTWASFWTRAIAVAGARAKLMIDIHFRPGMGPVAPDGGGVPYPIAEFEWEAFIRDIETYTAQVPHVYVVDSKYTAGI